MELAPQRATVYAAITQDGPHPDPVFAAVADSLATLRASIADLAKAGAVRWYSVDQIRLGSHRPWNADGEQLPLVHSAAVSVAVRFKDFDALSRWVSAQAGLPGLAIGHIDWTLRRRTRAKTERSTRKAALRDARRRAQDYADALDLGTVRVRTISDPGVGGASGRVRLANSMAAPLDGPPEIDLEPEPVEVAAHVEATFDIAVRT